MQQTDSLTIKTGFYKRSQSLYWFTFTNDLLFLSYKNTTAKDTCMVIISFYTPRKRSWGGVYRFHPVCLSEICCPQLLLNESKDFNKTWWNVRIHNGNVHILRNLIFDNFCRRYGCLDLVVFHSFMGQCVVRNSS